MGASVFTCRAVHKSIPAKHYQQLAAEKHCLFLDAGSVVKISDIDGMHFEQSSHLELAKMIAREIIA